MAMTFTIDPVDARPVSAKPWTREDELELLALVQLGLQTGEVEECHSVYLSPFSQQPNKFRSCMIGAAMIGKFGGGQEAYQQFRNFFTTNNLDGIFFSERLYVGFFSEATGINRDLLLRASSRHMANVKIEQQMFELQANCYN